jgi:hypothetical protein
MKLIRVVNPEWMITILPMTHQLVMSLYSLVDLELPRVVLEAEITLTTIQ